MTTAFTMMERLWRSLGQLEQFTATNGSTSTALTTSLSGLYSDDDFKGGTLLVLRDAGGASAAPEGEMQKISAFTDDGTTQTFTVDTVFTAAVASGDTIGFAKGQYPKEITLSLLNDALLSLGRVPYADTSLTTVASQVEYTLPVALKEDELCEVLIQTDTNLNIYKPLAWWKVYPSAAGSTSILQIHEQDAGYKLQLLYVRQHPAITAVTGTISEYIHPELLLMAMKVKALGWQIMKLGQSAGQSILPSLYNAAQQELSQVKRDYPIWQPQPKHKYFAVTNDDSERLPRRF